MISLTGIVFQRCVKRKITADSDKTKQNNKKKNPALVSIIILYMLFTVKPLRGDYFHSLQLKEAVMGCWELLANEAIK